MSIFVKHLQIIELPLAEIEADDFTLDWTIRWQPILFYLFLRIWGFLIIKRCEIKIIVVTWRIASRRHTVQNHLFSSLPLTSWRCKWELEKERKKEMKPPLLSTVTSSDLWSNYTRLLLTALYTESFSPLSFVVSTRISQWDEESTNSAVIMRHQQQ